MTENEPWTPTYSYSMMTTFLSCRHAFYERYIRRGEPGVEAIERFLGSRVHDACQYIHLTKSERGTIPSREETLEFYRTNWTRELDALRAAGQRLVSVEKVEGLHMQVDASRQAIQEAFARGRPMVENYYDRFHPFTEDVEIEKDIYFDLEGRRVRVKIDALSPRGPTYRLIELKTSKEIGMNRKEWRRQVSLYILGVKEHERQKGGRTAAVEPLIYHLKSGTLVSIPDLGSPADLESTRRWALETIQEIERVTENWGYQGPERYPSEPSNRMLCPWCAVFKECPRWAHLVRIREIDRRARDSDPGLRLVREIAELQERLADVKARLAEYARSEGVSVIEGMDARAYISRVPALPDRRAHRERYTAMENALRSLGEDRVGQYFNVNTYQLRSDMAKGKLDPKIEDALRPFIMGEETSVFVPENGGRDRKKGTR